MSLAVDASVSDHVVISLSDLVREVFGDCDDEDDEEERREESDLHPSFYPGRDVETSPAARRMESPRLSDLVDRAPNLPLSVIASVNKSIASVAELRCVFHRFPLIFYPFIQGSWCDVAYGCIHLCFFLFSSFRNFPILFLLMYKNMICRVGNPSSHDFRY